MQIKRSAGRAFTLIELIIVVVIIGVVYMFAVGSLEKVKQTSQNTSVSLKNLKRFLLNKEFEKKARLVCFDRCEKCSVVLDGAVSEEIDSFFQTPPKIYRYTQTLGMEPIDPQPFFDQNDVEQQSCFSYTIYKNGIGDQIFVEYKSKVYDYSDYFEDVKVYDSIEEIQNEKEAMLQKVLS